MRKIRTIAVLPTLFTLGNLVCGFFSIVVASRVAAPASPDPPTSQRIGITQPSQLVFDKDDPTHNIMLSGWLIFLAMVFDALDGHVARLSRTSSEFGAQLDSLCDVVTFGVAPDPAGLYASLRRANPAPFAGLLRIGDAALLSSSPERPQSRRWTPSIRFSVAKPKRPATTPTRTMEKKK